MSKTSPTQRTLQECKRRGWPAEVVEKFNFYTKRKRDLFKFIDIIAITPDGVLGIQATTGAHHADRAAKASAQEHYGAWVKVAKFAIWTWSKRGERGKRKLWTLREEAVSP